MKKQFLLICLVGLLSACNGGYKVYKEVSTKDYSFVTSEAQIVKIARYDFTTEDHPAIAKRGEDGDYYVYVSFTYLESSKKVPSFSKTAYYYDGYFISSSLIPAALEYEVAIFKSYSKVSYNESRKKIKYIEAINETAKKLKSSEKELKDELILPGDDFDGETRFNNYNSYKFVQNKKTTYVLIGSEDSVKLVPMSKSK